MAEPLAPDRAAYSRACEQAWEQVLGPDYVKSDPDPSLEKTCEYIFNLIETRWLPKKPSEKDREKFKKFIDELDEAGFFDELNKSEEDLK